jgi:hypothetical protein
MVEQCGNCRYFLLQNAPNGAGVCRRYPPYVVAGAWVTGRPSSLVMPGGAPPPTDATVSEVQNITGQHPPQSKDGWCGEFFPLVREIQ